MKYAMLLAVALVGSFAHASHTTCSSPSLYYSSVRHDFGTPPPQGMETGRLTIFSKGQLLENVVYTSGLGGYTIPKYGVSFVGPKSIVAETGTQAAGSIIYTETAVLSTLAPLPAKEILRSHVVCEQTWAMVP